MEGEIREADMFPTCDGSSVCRSSLDTDLEKKKKEKKLTPTEKCEEKGRFFKNIFLSKQE